jgi:hypothetical protein
LNQEDKLIRLTQNHPIKPFYWPKQLGRFFYSISASEINPIKGYIFCFVYLGLKPYI